MPSTLTFPSTAGFRDKLLARNLTPYTVPGSYTPPSGAIVREITIRDIGVTDSPGDLIENPPTNQGAKFLGLYSLNNYGPAGGYNVPFIQSLPLTVTSNRGIYDASDASLPQQSLNGVTWTNVGVPEDRISSFNKYGLPFIDLKSVSVLRYPATYQQYTFSLASLPQQSLTGYNFTNPGYSENQIGSLNKYTFKNIVLESTSDLRYAPLSQEYSAALASLPAQSLGGSGWTNVGYPENKIGSINQYTFKNIVLESTSDLIRTPQNQEYNATLASLPAQSLTGYNWPAYNGGIPENKLGSINRYRFPSIFLESTSDLRLTLSTVYAQYSSAAAELSQSAISGQTWTNGGVTLSQLPVYNKYSFQSIQSIDLGNDKRFIPQFQNYANLGGPVAFVASSYSPYQILLQDNPTGSDGTLSQDSAMAQIGAFQLNKLYQDRIDREIARNTVGRINLLNAVSDPLTAVRIAQGKTPLVERDWQITRPANFVFRAADFAARLGGFNFPGSVIPGDYFTTDEANLSNFGQIAAAFNGGKDPRGGSFGKFFGRTLSQKSPSQLFLDNTGNGQKSQLYSNLGFNRYAPDYNKGPVGEVLDSAKKLINNALDKPTKGGYYVGSKELNASRIDSPSGEVPLNPFGQEDGSIVYGPDKLAKEFEGDGLKFKFGLAGEGSYNGGGLGGGLVWTSPKYNNSGYHALVGGDQGSQDDEYPLIKSLLEGQTSQGYEFKQSSILDQTQRLLDSTPDGAKRLSHVGNAINQLSKVFNDGYKEITKGSKVISYTDVNGVVTGTEYCRIFTKDTPYYTFADLQKTDGNIRKFTYSVLDNTYNLNISPFKNPGSTNIVDGKVKKYMFSIENLAWRTSNRNGLTYNDLPECERGPNGGRVMWFPPYDITFSETSSPSFSENNFLGRPEPVYTYSNTKRSGQLSWKIVVDHPSILNTIVDKQLKNALPQDVNKFVDSFFAGCLKYDIYELARRWNTIPTNELFVMQQLITNPGIKPEDVEIISNTAPTTTTSDVKTTVNTTDPDLTTFVGWGYYFDNDIPDPNTNNTVSSVDYETTYIAYTGQQSTYEAKAKAGDPVGSFFNNVIDSNFKKNDDLLRDILKTFENNKDNNGNVSGAITITMVGSASSPQTKAYNLNLSRRRVDSVLKYFKKWNGGALAKYIDANNLKFVTSVTGEELNVSPKSTSGNFGPFNCSDNDSKKVSYDKKYSTDAMACRRVAITTIDNKLTKIDKPVTNTETSSKSEGGKTTSTISGNTPTPPTITTTQKLKEGISKKILRTLLSECDYFEMIQQGNPMFYDSIKQQLKYFTPAFHSTTPEGLNSRLTFLQQCMRPGDTIPVIGSDGKPKYTNAINTSFGAPPVLVLRIGDFFNTKIIPTSLNITYEPLVFDFNPEGIGVQPMIAKISLSFNIVGGMGLKEPINTLQNALSFNFYANTEMYDERAEWTDDSFKKIDEALVKAILDKSPVVGIGNVQNNLENNGGNAIGTVENKIESDAGTNGDIKYQTIMDSLLSQGQSYMDSATNKTEQIIKDYNTPTVQLFNTQVNYSKGVTNQFTTPKQLVIYGKPENVEQRVTSLFNKIADDINSGNFELIKLLDVQKYKSTTIKKVKSNLIKYIDSTVKSSLITSLSTASQELVTNQQNMVQTFAKLDFVCTKSDGYIKSDQTAKIYNITATTEVHAGFSGDTYDELVTDYTNAITLLSSYYDDLKSSGYTGTQFNSDDIKLVKDSVKPNVPKNQGDTNMVKAEQRFYVAMSKTLLNSDTYQNFLKEIVPDDIAGEKSGSYTLRQYVTEQFDIRVTNYKIEYDAEIKAFNDFKENETFKNKYKKWTPYASGIVRKFTFNSYVEGTNDQQTRLQNIYKNGNSNTDKATFNGKTKFN
jgi:hypothetical protein